MIDIKKAREVCDTVDENLKDTGHYGDLVLAAEVAVRILPDALEEIERLRLELNDTYVDDYGTTWVRPTAEAYALTCGALRATKEDNNHFLTIINDCREENRKLQEENKNLKKNLAECAGY